MRQDLIDVEFKRDEAIEHFDLDVNKKTLVILGGSLGARRINQLIEKELPFFLSKNIQVIWQCGKIYLDDYSKYTSNSDSKKAIQVHSYIDRMDLVYAAADLIISRAGASSVSELCLVAKPTIFIPSPNVAENHQAKNAQAVVDNKAGFMIYESQLEKDFESLFNSILTDESIKNEVATNMKKMAKPLATETIVEQIIKLIK